MSKCLRQVLARSDDSIAGAPTPFWLQCRTDRSTHYESSVPEKEQVPNSLVSNIYTLKHMVYVFGAIFQGVKSGAAFPL